MKRFHYQVTVDLADQDEDLKNLVPKIIRDRFDGTAVKVVFTGGPLDDGEMGGVHEPRGDSPDSPPAGVDGVPGPVGSQSVPLEVADRDTRVDWPAIPAGYEYMNLGPAYVSLDCVNFHEVPEGTSLSDFLVELAGNQGVDDRHVLS